MRTKKYSRLSLKERVLIETLLQANKTKSYIANKLISQVDHWAICKIENNQEVDERYITKVKSLL